MLVGGLLTHFHPDPIVGAPFLILGVPAFLFGWLLANLIPS